MFSQPSCRCSCPSSLLWTVNPVPLSFSILGEKASRGSHWKLLEAGKKYLQMPVHEGSVPEEVGGSGVGSCGLPSHPSPWAWASGCHVLEGVAPGGTVVGPVVVEVWCCTLIGRVSRRRCADWPGGGHGRGGCETKEHRSFPRAELIREEVEEGGLR